MIWNQEALFAKSRVFYLKLGNFEVSSDDYALNAALSLELLSRSALSFVSPVLNADPQNEGQNILFALGFDMKKGFPRSIPFHSVTARLEQIIDEYQKKGCRSFSDYFAGLRNEELHTGGAPFQNLKNSQWLPKFYQTVKVLCDFIKKPMLDLIGEDDVEEAERLIDDLENSESTKAKEKIARAKAIFNSYTLTDREERVTLAKLDTSRYDWRNNSTSCPACNSLATLYGLQIKTSEPKYENEELLSMVTFRAIRLYCKACDLELVSTSELISAEVEVSYTKYSPVTLHDYYQPEYEDEYMNM
jgi:hypothetical protein